MTNSNPHGSEVLVGVIGGSGIYRLDALKDAKYYTIDTPFGAPSGEVCVANVNGVACAFIPRHGPNHSLNPSEVNYRANIYALKLLGVRYLLAVNAVGSLDAACHPGDVVLVDQVIDRTVGRPSTFFEKGIVAHVDYAYPTSNAFRQLAYDAILKVFPDSAAPVENVNKDDEMSSYAARPWRLHKSGTAVTMEGPQFSTRAESLWNKSLGAHLIGMTTATEAKLAREAEMAYLVIATVTDMDSWCDGIPHVQAVDARRVMAANAEKSQKIMVEIIDAIGRSRFTDPAHSSMAYAVCTKPEAITREVRLRLAPLLAKYPQFAP
ncbi:methylthioadenosine phosphorylase [Trypanosoma theileri]|uniref:S-methyl-5'-thioadenosine phosphorylase n=1 Tax=Trypanosoma theileri TaxID=67003 RepID=A0A1X0NKF0_9TRYP|nr:methylthioadenosine phosphorylase [Trypanosoma theileri]ORC85071.1 methylthioadenosine phosphorylase [Trypanosoma theileri]